ncbi:helix-turn-helix transcriptional regulator [Noviherbaspirillum malthae]
MTQAQLAEGTDLSRRTIIHLEQGEKTPSLAHEKIY